MQWAEVLADKSLRDLPYKIELDRWGNVIMSPASNRHGRLQGMLFSVLEKLPDGRAFIECSVATTEGVKVANVAWCSDAFFNRYDYETPYPRASEICVEVRSPSKSEEELNFKTRLYLEAGALEVWIVLETGEARFFGVEGERAQSYYGVDPRPLLNH
jgi:Uma2 family endonuclease